MKLIGEGSYAKVFLYNDPIYNIPIALKRADPSLDNKELERFKQEFQILKEFHSPYLIEAYAFDSKRMNIQWNIWMKLSRNTFHEKIQHYH